MRRRNFLITPAAAFLAPIPLMAAPEQRVYALGDGIPHTPAEYSALLAKLAAGQLEADDYGEGGVVEKLEAKMAGLLGKEAAVWLPTGTLANHLAVRLHADKGRRVVVQADSHLYNDSGDCAQTLSGLNLAPLARGQATFSVADVERAASDALMGRVGAQIGAVHIETPVRRLAGQYFAFAELARISAWARQRRAGLHLDGARLFVETAYTGRALKDYAALFDTVYISMYKCFNAASGAILAGPKALLGAVRPMQRMFGGGLAHVWPSAAVALHYLDGFAQSFADAKAASETVLRTLSADSNFTIERIPDATNIFRLRVHSVNSPVYHLRLEEAGISARPPAGDWLTLQVNPTWNRVPPAEIVSRFRLALG